MEGGTVTATCDREVSSSSRGRIMPEAFLVDWRTTASYFGKLGASASKE